MATAAHSSEVSPTPAAECWQHPARRKRREQRGPTSRSTPSVARQVMFPRRAKAMAAAAGSRGVRRSAGAPLKP